MVKHSKKNNQRDANTGLMSMLMVLGIVQTPLKPQTPVLITLVGGTKKVAEFSIEKAANCYN